MSEARVREAEVARLLAAFGEQLREDGLAGATIENYLAEVSTHLATAWPTRRWNDDGMLVRFRDSLRRLVPTRKPLARDPASAHALQTVRTHWWAAEPGLWAAIAIAYHAGLRPQDVARLDAGPAQKAHRAATAAVLSASWDDDERARYARDGTVATFDRLVRDIVEEPWGLAITLRTSKTGKARTGLAVATGGPLCPARAWRHAARHRDSMEPLDAAFVMANGQPVRYQDLRRALQVVGDAALLPHSLRIGSTTALANAGVDATWIQQHGGWASPSSVLVYRRWATPALESVRAALAAQDARAAGPRPRP